MEAGDVPGVSDPHVLLIEDDPAGREDARSHLTAQGFHLTAVGDAESALELARTEEFDLVLVALDLGDGTSGLDVVGLMVSEPALAATPVLALTPPRDREMPLDALERGAHDYVSKPLDGNELLARCAAALRTRRLHQELLRATRRLEQEPLTDELTGLANRPRALDELERAAAGSRRHGRRLSVLVVDVDSLETVNACHGRAAGDAAFREVCRRVTHTVRAADLVARLGDDDLLVVVSDAPAVEVALLGDRVRQSIAGAPFSHAGAEFSLTASVGWASWSGEEVPELLERALGALASAKAAGRNAVHPLA